MRYSTRIFRFLLIFSLEFTFSCSTAVPASHPPDRQRPIDQVAKLPSELGWSPRQTAGNRQYLIQDSTAISTTVSTPQTRVVQTKSTYSIHISRSGDSLFLTAKQDSTIVISQFPFSKPSPNFNTTQVYHAILSSTGQILSLTQDSSPSCSEGLAPAGMRTYDLVISYPTKRLQVGDNWIDTVSTIICRGKNLVRQQAIRTYRILGFGTWKQQPVITIKRLITSSLSTSSGQIQNQFDVNGFATSSSLISANQVTGSLLQSDTQVEATLTISTKRGVFPFAQVENTHIELQ